MLDQNVRELVRLLSLPPSDDRQLRFQQLLTFSLSTTIWPHIIDEQTDRQLTQLLLVACRINDITIATILLNNGTDPNRFGSNPFDRGDVNGDEITPLYVAATLGFGDMVELLLSQPRIDINRGSIEDEEEITPIYIASEKGHSVVVTKLLSAGANPNAEQDYTPLHVAAMSGDVATVQALLDANADVDARDALNSTPLLYGVEESFDYDDDYQQRIAIIRLLLRYGANPLAKDSHGNTPLKIARDKNNSEIETILLQAVTPTAIAAPSPQRRINLPTLFQTPTSNPPTPSTDLSSQEDSTPPAKRRKEGDDSQEKQAKETEEDTQDDTKKFSGATSGSR
jgi:ankyrin repeat protein